MKAKHRVIFKTLHGDGELKKIQTKTLRHGKPNYKGKSSQYKGVYWDNQTGKWMASLCINQKKKRKRFSCELEAAKHMMICS